MTIVAEFSIPYIRILNENGKALVPLPEFAKDKKTLLQLYRVMVLTNLFDKKAIALQRTGKMGTYAPINGQEAVSTAVGHALHERDIFVPYYRDYAAQFQRGVKMSEILTYWGGDERGNQFSCDSEDLPICVPIASQCLHAAGVAFAFQYRNQPRVALVCLGDGGTSEGDFYEAMNIAGVWNLPLVFVINNNQWAISVNVHQQTHCKTLAQKAVSAGFKGIQVDGNDVIAMRMVVGEAIENARQGLGPTLIEAKTYRLSDHTTADDATRYQPKAEIEKAILLEPVARMRHFLQSQGFWDEKEEEQLLKNCAEEVQEAVNEYLAKPPQSLSSIFDYHYKELPSYLLEQRTIALEEANHA